MATWDPGQYLAFAAERERPAIELMARIDLSVPARICDLGCGAGNVTRLLARRWPAAEIVGVDSSQAMLAAARAALPDANFIRADLATWVPEKPADLIFSNAALQWAPDRLGPMRRLLASLPPDGVLAVQMPRNFDAPSHRAIVETAATGPWRERLTAVAGVGRVEPPEVHYRNLAPLARRLDIWESEYLHVLAGPDPVLEWIKGTALRPYLDALDGPGRDGFLAACAARLRAAYPPEPDGATLFPFRRLFLVAMR